MNRSDPQESTTLAHLGRLERRAESLRERIAARGGATASTSEEAAELSSIEAAIALFDAARWRRSADEPIEPDIDQILAAVVDQDAPVLLRRVTSGWRCGCGCDRQVSEDRVYRWRPVIAAGPGKDDDAPVVSPASYRGRKRLAIIDDRIRYLTSRADELKKKRSPARYEKDELEALKWIRELALGTGHV